MERPAPDVYISVVPPQDSRFSKRLRSGAEEQRVQRAPGSGISGLRESGEQLNSPAPLGMRRNQQLNPTAPLGMTFE